MTHDAAEPEPSSAGDAARVREIRKGIIAAGRELRAAHPWLEARQDAIGLSIFVVAAAGALGSGVAGATGAWSPWVSIPVTAVFLSLLHELEHDLIHDLYFRGARRVQDLLLLGVWALRPSTISPWVRRALHLHHHRVSGTESDVEERGITNGVPWGLRRLLMTGDNVLAIVLRPFESPRMLRTYVRVAIPDDRAARRRLYWRNALGYFSLGFVHYALWHGFLLFSALRALGVDVDRVPAGLVQAATAWAIALAAPNALRTFSLHFISSNMHFYGDVEAGNVLEQCQVFRAWWLWPLQLFCFNFGATHAFHHFVVRDPFYVRQWLAPRLYGLLRDNGVRFDDFGTFLRANRRGPPASVPLGQA